MAFTVADYILKRLADQYVDRLFGVPAAYCAPLFDAALSHRIRSVVAASDLEAGYAADGYARTKGLGAVSVAYGVGALSMINAIAGAYVERSPVVVINGGPTPGAIANLRKFDIVFSHSIGQVATDLNAYKLVTALAVRAVTAAEAPGVVDLAISTAILRKRPVYLEINMDIWTAPCAAPSGPLQTVNAPVGDEQQLAATIVGLIRAAHAPLILIGVEVQRYGHAKAVADLITKLGVRWSTTLLAKSVLAEGGDGWVGVYDPPHSQAAVKRAVERADLLVTLGCAFPNGYANLVQNSFGRMVQIYDGKVRIKAAAKQNAELGALVSALVTEAAKKPPSWAPGGAPPPVPGPASGALTYRQVFERIAVALDQSWIVIPDTFLGVYSAANLPIKGRDGFLCSAVWASIGHSVAAAVGASFGAARRPLVICGDGGFQMTAPALSTMAQHGCNPVIIIVSNGIYGYEQFLVDRSYFESTSKPPRDYVVLNRWDFVAFASGLGLQLARAVNTAVAFDAALAEAAAFDGPALIAAQIDPHGLPVELP
ncbi:thiamine pyrophosphate-dependent enzyme [Methylosinus sp. PW1]|uniref:thiamine pyrophosphate-dependent enzyme n=1 Tax=Methylosinus sp. PW1 TaxID=107636 RepID=UPI00055D3EB7|nr:thiamine pyrophosphate-dependent enzyme [Methylosinus sp. PW1]